MDRFVIGTAGHVDHGKTTLVRALTGVSTDRLPEEKRRGITIELGFARWAVAPDVDASVVDVPGHRRLVHTMIAGASGIELVLLVVAADEGVMPQTREHVAACELLGLRTAVVALTKVDRVDDDTRALAEEDVRELLGDRWDHAIVPCSVTSGGARGLDALRDAVAAKLRALRGGPPRETTGPRLWVDRVMSVRGAGTVVTGTLTGGPVKRGDVLAVASPRGVREAHVREVHVHGAPVPSVVAPTRLALNLAIDASEVRRGDLVVAKESAPAPTDVVDVLFRGEPPRRGASVTFHVGTTHVGSVVTRAEPLVPGEHLLRLRLAEPRPIAGGDRFLLRGSAVDARSGALAGGGIVLDAQPSPRSKRAVRVTLALALREGDAGLALDALLMDARPRALTIASLGARLAIAPMRLESIAESRSDLMRCGAAFAPRRLVAELATEARRLVAEHAAAHPLDRGLPLATLRQRLAAIADADMAEAAVRAARARRGPDDVDAIAIEDDVAVLAVRRDRVPRELSAAMARVRADVEGSGVHGLSLGHVVEVTGWTTAFAKSVLAALERSGVASRAGDLWFSCAIVDSVRTRTVEHLRRAERVTVIELKALCGLPRRQAILLLEHFDAAGITRRVGDARVLGGAA